MTAMLKGNREETKKGSKKALVWNDESDRAFEGTKQALLSAVGLHLVDPDRGFVLRTDASDYAVGAVLEQVLDDGRHVPVAFWSRVLAEGQRGTWTPREKEAYAIVMALRKWAWYIALHPITVCTDHQSLRKKKPRKRRTTRKKKRKIDFSDLRNPPKSFYAAVWRGRKI